MRVLFVVDNRYWIIATEARQIIEHNPNISGVLCSGALLDELLNRAPYLKGSLDLIHFMLPGQGRRHLNKFLGKRPCVASIHHLDPKYHPDVVSLNAKADAIMVVADMWRSKLVSMGIPESLIVVVPNGVDTKVFRPPSNLERSRLRKEMGFTSDDIVIGINGKPDPANGWRKGIDVFLQALKLLAKQGLPLAVVVGGPGWEKTLTQIQALGIKAHWRRFVPDLEDVAPMYRALDFYWVTSRIEGGPVPLLEAMSSGVCCISTRVGVAPEVIEDGENGYSVDIEDATRIATLTQKLIENGGERERMGREARNTIISKYDWSKTARLAPQLYNAAVSHFEHRFHSVSHLDGGRGRILTPQDARWLDAQERLIWARRLCRMGERNVAFRQAWYACLRYPFSPYTWRLLAHLLLPRWVREFLEKTL